MTMTPVRPAWDLDDFGTDAESDNPDDYEYQEPDAVPTRVSPDEPNPFQIPVGPI